MRKSVNRGCFIMEDLNLTETEMRYFGDLFLCCDEESNGKIPILKATELFRSSNVSNDVLKQVNNGVSSSRTV